MTERISELFLGIGWPVSGDCLKKCWNLGLDLIKKITRMNGSRGLPVSLFEVTSSQLTRIKAGFK